MFGFGWRRFWRRRKARRVARNVIYSDYSDRKRRGWSRGQIGWLLAVLFIVSGSAAVMISFLFTPPPVPPVRVDDRAGRAVEPDRERESISPWDRAASLDPNAPPSVFTGFKLRVADRDGEYCAAALERAYAKISAQPDRPKDNGCGLIDVVELTRVSDVTLKPVVTRCAIALRLYMWERHDLREIAREILDAELVGMRHMGSYSCRKMRTSRGSTNRMSEHATANAIDISGFDFDDGSTIMLSRDWGKGAKGEFLKAARDSACKRFNTVLGPDFNSLHHDHFHFDQGGARICR